MANADRVAPPTNPSLASPAAAKPGTHSAKSWCLLAGAAALVAIIFMPQPAGLSVAGQHMLGIFAFAIIVWVTEAIDYAASSIILMALIAFLLGTAPDPVDPERLLGTGAALSSALAGFTNSAVALIAASLVIAAAMSITGLDKRVAFKVISAIGTSPRRILAGIIVVMAILAFFIPTASSRVACLVPILMGIISVAAAALLFVPNIGMLDWKQVQSRIPWGILIQLGVGVGLGTGLLKTGAAGWLATFVVNEFGVQHMSGFAILAVLWLFMIVVHLGFSSGAAMATTMIPVMISVLQDSQIPTTKVAGMTMLLAFATSIGWILPINGPQNMLAFGTDTFEARDFIRVGLVMTVIAYVLLLVFAATWWHWLGYV